MILASAVPEFLSCQKVLRTDRQTDRPKPICPLNFFEVGGIKTVGEVDYTNSVPESVTNGRTDGQTDRGTDRGKS